MDYSKLSDFEVNYYAFLLSAKKGLISFKDIMTKQNPGENHVMYGDGANWFKWDGCNNPSDAWPIILENNIELSPLYRGDWCASAISEYTYEEEPVYNIQTQAVDTNPLRAAMIVYLMMRE